MAIEDREGMMGLLRAALANPEEGVDRLPLVVEALAHEEPSVRVGAAWVLCRIAAEHPSRAPDLCDRLADRPGTAASLAGTWIDREVIGDDRRTATSESDERASTRSNADPTVPDGSNGSTGTDSSGGGSTESGQPTADAGTGESRRSSAGAGSDGTERPTAAAGSDDTALSTADAGRPSPGGPTEVDEVVDGDRFTIPLDRTALDGLQVVDRVATDRHSWTYVGMAQVDAERRAVLVRTYRPPQGGRLGTFASAFEDVLTGWDGVDDHDAVLRVYDWGRRPHPWVVLEYASDTLRGVGRLSTEAAFRVGLDAASALAHAHDRGVTHRCLDPRALALDTRPARPVGRLLNFGIVDAFRAVDGPLPMDSRYAAPELFDDDYGGVDWLTDVYHLGAVLYTAFTGQPPYEESLVGRGGPAGRSYDPPSEIVDGLPVAADRIVAKSMATHKISRYESADELVRDLRSALEDGVEV